MAPTDLTDLTAVELVELMRSGDASVREVLDAHLARIDEVNPGVNAIVALDGERARAAADDLDAHFTRNRQDLPPLYGLPIAHKDTLPVRGWLSTSGSTVFADTVPEVDHIVVEREKAAGVVTLGKTNVPELGLGSHTFNPVYGRTNNPWDLGRSAGGSSGGAAAALAARMLPIADGSDTGGSLRTPASFCNVVGLRPSLGTVPSWPEKQPWTRLSVKGPLARTVRDLYLLLSVQAGDDPRSPVGYGAHFPGLDHGLDPNGIRVAWSHDLGLGIPVEDAVTAALTPVVGSIADLGAVVEDTHPDLTGAAHAFGVLRAWQFEATLGSLVETHGDQLGESIHWNVEVGRRLSGPEVSRAELESAIFSDRIREFFTQHDFLVCPVAQVVPFDGDLDYPHSVAGVEMHDYLEWMTLPSAVTMTGCPALSLPAGFTSEGLPVGLQVIGPPRSEQRLLEFALTLEEAFGAADRRPTLISGTPVGSPR